MTTLDILYYLVLGMILGGYTTLQGWFGQRAGPAPGLKEDGLEASLRAICRLERTNDLEQLLKRLTQRYEIIVTAFADGAIDDCAEPMGVELRAELSAALAGRQQRGEKRTARLITAYGARIVAATVANGTVSVDIAFTALVQHLLPSGVAADTYIAPVEAADIWTFDRSTDRHHPEWLLVATEPVQ